MRLSKEYAWPLVGLTAVIFSVWLLYHQIRDISMEDVLFSLDAIAGSHWILAVCCTVLAFVALAGYDSIALRHLRKRLSFPFVFACSFTTYALAHNIGASVVSGAVIRYRAYTSKGLSGAEVGVLVAFCSITFTLACVFLAGITLVLHPQLLSYFIDDFPIWGAYILGFGLLGVIVLYIVGSLRQLTPLHIRNFTVEYPRPLIVLAQLLIGPLEVLAAAGIIYFALPAESNPGYLIVLGIFVASFSAAMLSHAPGGLGVLEVMFFLALPDIDAADLLAALLVFRFFYLLIPFALSLIFVLMFERSQLTEILKKVQQFVQARRH